MKMKKLMIVGVALLMQSCILCTERNKTPAICIDCCEPVAGADPKGVTNE